ncbi:transposon Tf2-8 polyprotein [Trichonephila clavipes]|nr:transposon Tf2-8 polyprotein [Trichonephila clavipes]
MACEIKLLESEATTRIFVLLGEQGNNTVLDWVMKEGLISSRYECPKCKKDMRLVERKSTIDGFEWRCQVQSKENPHFVCRSLITLKQMIKMNVSINLWLLDLNASSTKIPWTKLLDQVCNEYNSTPHSITKYPPAYLLFGLLPYQSPIDQNNYYEPVDEARELALQRTIDYHIKNKIRYIMLAVLKKNSTQVILLCMKSSSILIRGN